MGIFDKKDKAETNVPDADAQAPTGNETTADTVTDAPATDAADTVNSSEPVQGDNAPLDPPPSATPEGGATPSGDETQAEAPAQDTVPVEEVVYKVHDAEGNLLPEVGDDFITIFNHFGANRADVVGKNDFGAEIYAVFNLGGSKEFARGTKTQLLEAAKEKAAA